MKNELKDYWEDEKRKKVIQRIEEKNIKINFEYKDSSINLKNENSNFPKITIISISLLMILSSIIEEIGNLIIIIWAISWIYAIISVIINDFIKENNKIVWILILIFIPPLSLFYLEMKDKQIIQKENINIYTAGEEKNININLNTEIENDNSIIIYLIAGVISIGLIFGVYSFVKNETKKEIEYLKVQRIIQSNEYSKNISKYKTENEEILNEKEFKIKYKSLDNSNINFYDYNINTILSNIRSVYSKGTDNNYKIEIIINISKYGTFFYRIYNINTSKEYNENFIRILDEMKKIRFRENEKDTNLKITIHNNDYDLN